LHISIVTPRLRNLSLSFISLRESLNSFNWRSIARISFTILVTRSRTILTRAETAIAEYTPTDSVLVKAVAAIAAPGVPAIGKRVRGAAAERVPLRPRILLRVEVLIGGEVLVGGGRRSGAGGDGTRTKLCGY